MATGQLPLKDYLSLHSYLSLLLCASFVTLPHSTKWLGAQHTVHQVSSTDRPEHPFLTPITSQPLITMTWDLVGMLICMGWWGHRMQAWWTGHAKQSHLVNEKEFTERQQRTSKLLNRITECAIATLAATPIYVGILIALGAPLDSHRRQTILVSLHLSILTVWPVVHAFGIPSIYDSGTFARFRMTRLFCEFRPENPLERALVYPVIGTLTGAWLGAVPIPLDWDRPWQSYPLTVTVGSILGFIIGGFVSWFHSALEDSLRAQIDEPVSHTTTKKNKKKKKT